MTFFWWLRRISSRREAFIRWIFEHEGALITSPGNGVYSVGARANWYPRSGAAFAEYNLKFRYPRRLTLVTPGDIVSDIIDGDWRITERHTPVPVRVAGFNLGEYEKSSATVAGLTVDVYGNRRLDPALQPPPRATILPGWSPLAHARRRAKN